MSTTVDETPASSPVTIVAAAPSADGWSFEPEPITAGAYPVKPPRAWFENPGLTEPTALTVTADGRVYGHAAAWGVRHIGLPGHVTAPRSKSGYRYYLTGQVETDDGSMVNTGRISLGGGHADMAGSITAATAHYDDVCSAVSDVTVGEDAHGLWFSGALRPDVTPEQVRALRASSVSGDWRPVSGDLEFCGLLAVNLPGFSMPRAALAASGEPIALVAAGAVHPHIVITASTQPSEATDPVQAFAPYDQHLSTPEETPVPDKPKTDEPTESVTAAAPPFAKGDPSADPMVDTSDEAEQVAEGSPVGVPDGQTGVVTEVDENQVASVLVQVPLSDLKLADEKAVMASAAGIRERVKEAKTEERFSKLTEQLAGLTAALQASDERHEKRANAAEVAPDLDHILASAKSED